MANLPMDSVREWMSFLNRETVDRCFLMSRKLYVASSLMTTMRVVDTACLREYETMRNYNFTIAWTTVGRSRRGKPKTEKKMLQINRDNAYEAIALFSAALRFCIVKERIEVNLRSLLLHPSDVDQLYDIKELRLKDAKITVGEVRFAHFDHYQAAAAFLSILNVSRYYFESLALSMDLLQWADANGMYDRFPSVYMDERALTEDMILYRCFGGRSTKRFSAFLPHARVSPQFLRKLVKARRGASTRREVRLEMWLRTELEVDELNEQERPIVANCHALTEFTFADIEDFKMEYWVYNKLKCTAN